MNPVIAYADAISPCGRGVDACWSALLAGRSAIRPDAPWARDAFITKNAAWIPDVDHGVRSRLLGMLDPMLDAVAETTPPDAGLLLATTTGEIDRLEKHVLAGDFDAAAGSADPAGLLDVVRRRIGVEGPCATVSAACASSSVAVIQAVEMIRAGRCEAVLVVAGDALSEFVFAGFSTLMALSPGQARPFDRDRDGLTLGEAAAVALVLSAERAEREGLSPLAEVCGWGIASDANHMTGPSRTGDGLARAVQDALHSARGAPSEIQSVCAHGTGTVYNDAMEMKAFKLVFGASPVPVYSIKGATGHTMGGAGLLELLIAIRSLREGIVPACVGLNTPDADAAGWVTTAAQEAASDASLVLSTNSGFGGVNSAVILGQPGRVS